jgi:hypothetical protein
MPGGAVKGGRIVVEFAAHWSTIRVATAIDGRDE